MAKRANGGGARSATKAKARKPAAKPASRPAAALPPARLDGELRDLVGQLALLAAANNLMAQSAFLSVERLRITSQVVDEAVSNDFGNQLYERCEKLCEVSDDLVLRLLDRVGADSAQADLVRGLVSMRREFHGRTSKPAEQRRLLESLERMYR